LVCGALLWVSACAPTEPGPVTVPDPAEDETSVVVMVSFDGMRHDFIDRAPAPNFQRLASRGVRAEGLIPGYPSKTFPNHYGIATGLYPARHGLVDNTFYDPVFDAAYSIGDRDAVQDGRWYLGEPIWVTAERQGVRTASYFWVGTEAPIQGIQPTYFKYYDGSVPYAARVDTVLHWLSLPPPDRPRLVLLYFDEPDGTAHRRGPDHPAAVHNSTQSLLYLDGDPARIDQAYGSLAGRLDRATVYRKGETPDRWHYDEGRRIPDLIVAADPGWMIRLRDWNPWSGGGMHGWDPQQPAMRGIFLAAGPRIRPGTRIPAFENVHIYPFVAHLLGLEPAEGIDGSLEVLNGTLVQPGSSQ
jgi:predicted AlkP superfamily pyrophosphatase or phosphodiesterase